MAHITLNDLDGIPVPAVHDTMHTVRTDRWCQEGLRG